MMKITILFMGLLTFVSAQQDLDECICTGYVNNSYVDCQGQGHAAGYCNADSSCDSSQSTSVACFGNNSYTSIADSSFGNGYDDSCVCFYATPAPSVQQNMTECICTGYLNSSYVDCQGQGKADFFGYEYCNADSSCTGSTTASCFGNNSYTTTTDIYYGNGYDDDCICNNWSDVIEALATAIIVAIVIGSLVCCGIVVAILCCVCGGIACCCAAGAGAGAAAGNQQQQQNQMTTV